ncbi:WD40 repeat domain-containing protein [Schlesneria paludicola]|uniref:WD40 repeat domain-containing protein n=1 Tax=Schlesneria paludicola TaxID=360056 RepID=UPI00029A5278|nr:PQQ-binding-like beta-propeller repeat protein [Schlesneria paludicola]
MHRRRLYHPSRTTRGHRNGLLFIGALREVSLIALVVGLLLMAIRESSSLLQMHGTPKGAEAPTFPLDPIMNLDFDRDRRTLIAHTYPEGIDEIRVSNAVSKKRISPQNLFSTATSEINSTTMMLTQWTHENSLHHGVYFLRNDQVVHSEEFILKVLSTADARISRDGSIALMISHNGTIIGWDLTQSPPNRWEFHLEKSSATNQLSPDGTKLVIAANDGNPLICDSRSGEVIFSLPAISSCCRSAAWSSDGQRLSLGDEHGNVFVYDTVTGQQVWMGHINFLFARSMALSFDGNILAAGGFDKKIRIWDLANKTHSPARVVESTSVVNDVIITDDTLFAACLDGTIREWSLKSEQQPRQIR